MDPSAERACGDEGLDLQHKVAAAGAAQAQLLLVQVGSEPGQVLVLSADVCRKDQRTQVRLHAPAEGKTKVSEWGVCVCVCGGSG